jgi:hypothetical protein
LRAGCIAANVSRQADETGATGRSINWNQTKCMHDAHETLKTVEDQRLLTWCITTGTRPTSVQRRFKASKVNPRNGRLPDGGSSSPLLRPACSSSQARIAVPNSTRTTSDHTLCKAFSRVSPQVPSGPLLCTSRSARGNAFAVHLGRWRRAGAQMPL